MAAVQQHDQQRHLVHKQFNSPMGLYSDQNVKETLDREIKAFGGTGIELDNQYHGKPSNLQNSAVLKMLEEEESERYTAKRNHITTERKSRARQRCLIDRDTVLKINRRHPKRDYSWPPPDSIYSRSRSSSDEQFNEDIRHKHQIDHIKEMFDNGTIFQHKNISTINKINCRKNQETIINLNHPTENENNNNNNNNNKLNIRSRSLNDNFRGNNNAKSNNELLSNYNLIQTNVNKMDDNIKNDDNDDDDDSESLLFVKNKFYLPENELYIGMVEPTRKYFEDLSKKNQISFTTTANELSLSSDALLYDERKKCKSTENFIDFHPYCYNNNSIETRTKHDSSQQQQIFNSILKSDNKNNSLKVQKTFTPTSKITDSSSRTMGINSNLRTLSLDRQLKKKYNSNNNSFNELPPLKPRGEYRKNLPSNNKTKLNLNNTQNIMDIVENSTSNQIQTNKNVSRNDKNPYKDISSSNQVVGDIENINNKKFIKKFKNCNYQMSKQETEQQTNFNRIKLKENNVNSKTENPPSVNNKKSTIKFKISSNNNEKYSNGRKTNNKPIENLIKSNQISYSNESPLPQPSTTNKEKTLLNFPEKYLPSDISSSINRSSSINKNDENKMKIFTKNNNNNNINGIQNKNNIIICNISDADESSKNKITKTKFQNVENINNKNDNKIVQEIRKNNIICRPKITSTINETFVENINNNFIYQDGTSEFCHHSSEIVDVLPQLEKYSLGDNKIIISQVEKLENSKNSTSSVACDVDQHVDNNYYSISSSSLNTKPNDNQILINPSNNENSKLIKNNNLPEMIITSDGINRIVNIINLNQNKDLKNLTNTNNNNKLYNQSTMTTSSLSSLLKTSPMYSKDFLYFNDDKKPYREMINSDKISITQDDNKKNSNIQNDENLVKNFLLEKKYDDDGENITLVVENIKDKIYSCFETNNIDISKPTDNDINIYTSAKTKITTNTNNNDDTSKATTKIQTTTNTILPKPKITKIYNNKPTKINECLTSQAAGISSITTTSSNNSGKKRHGIYYSNIDNGGIDIWHKDNETLLYDPKTIDLIYNNDSKEQIYLIDDKLNDLLQQNEQNKDNINQNQFKIELINNNDKIDENLIISNNNNSQDKQKNDNLSNIIINDKYSKIQKSISENLRRIDRYMESAEKSLYNLNDDIKPIIQDNIFIFETPLKKIMKHFMFNNNSKYHKPISILNEYNSFDPLLTNQTTENMPVVENVLVDLYNISLLLNKNNTNDDEIIRNPLEYINNNDKTRIIEINDNYMNIDEPLIEDQSIKDDTNSIIDSNNTSISTETLSTNSEPTTMSINMDKIIESKNILSGYLITKQNQEELFDKASSVLQQFQQHENPLIDLNTNYYCGSENLKSISPSSSHQQYKNIQKQYHDNENCHPTVQHWFGNLNDGDIKSLNDKNCNENYVTNNTNKLSHKHEDDDNKDKADQQHYYKIMSNKIADNVKFKIDIDKSVNFDYDGVVYNDDVNKQIHHHHHHNSNNDYPKLTTTHHNNVLNRNETTKHCTTMKRSSSPNVKIYIENDDNNNENDVNNNNNKSNKIDYILNNNNNDVDEIKNEIEIRQNKDLILTTSNHIKLSSIAKVELPKTIKLVERNDEKHTPSPTLSTYDNNVWEICDNNNNNSILIMPEINFDKQKRYNHETNNRNDRNFVDGGNNDNELYCQKSGENMAIKTECINKNSSDIMNNILVDVIADNDGQCGMIKTSINGEYSHYNDDYINRKTNNTNDYYYLSNGEHEILDDFNEHSSTKSSRGQSLNRESRSRSRVRFIDPDHNDDMKPKYQLRCTSQPPPIKHLIEISKDYINYDSQNYLNLYRQYSFDSNINNFDNSYLINSPTTLQLYPLDGQYEWTNQGYKRVAWPPADQARTYRAYTPQPTNQQPNQDNNSYQSQPTQSQYPQQSLGGGQSYDPNRQQPQQQHHQQPQQQHHQQPQQHQQSYPQSQNQQPQSPSYQPVNQGYQKPNYPGANQPSSQQQGYQPQQSHPQQQQGYQPQQSHPQQQQGYQPQQSRPQQQQGYQPQQSHPQQQPGYQPQQQSPQQGYQPQEKSQPEQGYVQQQPSSQQGYVHPSNLSQPHSPQPQQPNPYQQKQGGNVPYPHQDNNSYPSPSHPTSSVPSRMNGPGSTVSFTGGVAQRPTQSSGLPQYNPQPKPFQSQYNVPPPSAQSYQQHQQQQPPAQTGGEEQHRGWTHVVSPAPARTGYTQPQPNVYQPNMAGGGGAPQYGSDSQFGSNQNISSQQQPTNQAYQSVPVSHNQQPLSGQQQQPHFYQQPQQQNQMHPAQNQYHQQPSSYESQNNQYNQQPQQQYNSQADQQNPGVITLRRETPTHQPPAPVIVSQPATKSFRGNSLGGSIMRGDLKWPPQDCRERMAADAEWERQLSFGPACRPTKQPKDYSGFFAKHALAHNYPGYKIPPGTQHIEGSY